MDKDSLRYLIPFTDDFYKYAGMVLIEFGPNIYCIKQRYGVEFSDPLVFDGALAEHIITHGYQDILNNLTNALIFLKSDFMIHNNTYRRYLQEFTNSII